MNCTDALMLEIYNLKGKDSDSFVMEKCHGRIIYSSTTKKQKQNVRK